MPQSHRISALKTPRFSLCESLLALMTTLAFGGCSSSGEPATKDGSGGESVGTTGEPSSLTATASNGSNSTTTSANGSGTTATGTTSSNSTGVAGASSAATGTDGTGSAAGGTAAGTAGPNTTASGPTGSGGMTGSGGTAGTTSDSGGAGGTASGATTGSGGTGSVTCPETVMQSGDSTEMVQVGSLDRSYYLHIPSGYTGTEPLPLVIDFHPLGGTGMQQANSNGWKAKADSIGFIVAYPDSYNSNNSWNVGMCCQDAQQNQIDDVGFTKAMIEHISGMACVDPKRIYATGCSNGGGMTYKVACDLADTIAGAAPVDFRCVYGGSTDAPSCEGCMPSRPISITHFDNTGDNALVPYNGGLTSFPADCPPGQACTGMGFPSAAENFETWQQIDECTGSASSLEGHSECQTNDACEGGAQVTMCVQQGGSHCGNYSSLGIVDTAWELFEQQSL